MEIKTREHFEAISEGYPLDESIDEELDWKYEVVDEYHHKHDETMYTFVFQDVLDGKWYRGSYLQSYQYGIDSYQFPLELEEVEQVQVTKTVWRKVKATPKGKEE